MTSFAVASVVSLEEDVSFWVSELCAIVAESFFVTFSGEVGRPVFSRSTCTTSDLTVGDVFTAPLLAPRSFLGVPLDSDIDKVGR